MLIYCKFIYDAVMDHCIAVGTHRHGCCVLQRCVDHASPAQKVALVSCITAHAITLVQDPFGNYVVQYILDLDEPKLAEPLICRFKTKVCLLSKQKFSSNVIEKVVPPCFSYFWYLADSLLVHSRGRACNQEGFD